MTRLRVLAFGACDEGPGYPRAPALLADLRRITDLAVCTFAPPWSGKGKRAIAAAPARWLPAALQWWRSNRAARRELRRAIAAHRPDLLVVLHPAQLTVHLARREWRGPLVVDLFLSAYDTVVVDRRMLRASSLPARWLRRLDRRTCAAADLVLVDTPVQAERLPVLLGAERVRFAWLPAGEAHEPQAPEPYLAPLPGEPLRVLFFGTGVPLHGLPTLLAAVARVPDLQLTLIGGTASERAQAQALPADRIRLLPEFVARGELQQEILRAHLVAGVFGDSAKADAVLPFKVVHALAAGRPVVTAATSAVKRMLHPGRDCLVVPPADADALGDLLRRVQRGGFDLAGIAAAAARTHADQFAGAARARRLAEILGVAVAPVEAAAAAEALGAGA